MTYILQFDIKYGFSNPEILGKDTLHVLKWLLCDDLQILEVFEWPQWPPMTTKL